MECSHCDVGCRLDDDVRAAEPRHASGVELDREQLQFAGRDEPNFAALPDAHGCLSLHRGAIPCCSNHPREMRRGPGRINSLWPTSPKPFSGAAIRSFRRRIAMWGLSLPRWS